MMLVKKRSGTGEGRSEDNQDTEQRKKKKKEKKGSKRDGKREKDKKTGKNKMQNKKKKPNQNKTKQTPKQNKGSATINTTAKTITSKENPARNLTSQTYEGRLPTKASVYLHTHTHTNTAVPKQCGEAQRSGLKLHPTLRLARFLPAYLPRSHRRPPALGSVTGCT